MGSTFKYISDAALREEDRSYFTECQACGKKGVPVFKANGFLLKADGTYDDDDPDAEVYVACSDCILNGRIARFGEWEMDDFLNDNYENWQELRHALRRTPQIPLMMQRDDWVICCGDLCEFIGVPQDVKDLIRFTSTATFWDRGSSDFARNFQNDGPPESLREISEFQCLHCRRMYWTDQFT